MRKTLLTSLLLFLFLSLLSQNNSIEEECARSFFTLNHPYPNRSVDNLTVDTVLIYKNLFIVNFTSPHGFVIVRKLADERDIIAYSYNDHFSFDVDTTGAIESFADALTVGSDDVGYHPTSVIAKLKTGRYPVEPLCRTAWNQGWPYNYYCPVDLDQDRGTLVGCVAVAVGQIIRYYDKWNNFQIEHSYEHEVYGTLTCFAGHYNWETMENQCDGINHEVARLLYDSGVLVNMGYGPSSSGASSGLASSLFSRIYDGGGLNNSPYDSQESFYTSISQYKPIYSTYAGHAFVCDGFDGNSFYHFNLGWGGSANGYYPLSNVLGNSLLSAIFNTSPSDSLPPPSHLQKNILSDTEVEISWDGPNGDRSELTGYTIYLDDLYFGETSDTVLVHTCVPGSHYLRVTANWTTGESRWIGPASYYSNGNSIPIADDKLRYAINTSSGIPSAQRNSHSPTEGELFNIRSLNISNGTSLDGIGNCINLHQLVLYSSRSEKDIDLADLPDCRNLMLLKMTNYAPANHEIIGSLTKLQDLYLNNNSLTDMGFLSPLKDLNKLEVFDNEFHDITFLNDLDRLTRITLRGCGVESFDLLENGYGLEYIDVSNNAITDIEWLNGIKTLRTLIAANNQLTGEVNLNGLTLLRTLTLNENQIAQLHITSSPKVRTINIAANQISKLRPILEDNKQLSELYAPDNLIDTLPTLSNNLVILNLNNNRLFDLVPLDDYGDVVDLNLQGNRIVDISPLLNKNYSSRLEQLDLRNNPLSKESFMIYKPQISESAGVALFPSQFYSGSPCYLNPCSDSILMTNNIELNWEGDYENEGYQFDLYMRQGDQAASQIADGLTSMSFEIEDLASGHYSWFVVAHLGDEWLHSGYRTFKVFNGFSIPFFEDFEIYSPTKPLCSQSPFWRIFSVDQSSNKDAFVINTNHFEGQQSIKISGLTDLLFPISEYLTGYCTTKFRLMVEPNRQACIQSRMSDGTTLEFYFYSTGMCEIYYAEIKQKTFAFKHRTWMEMEISSEPISGSQWYLDDQLMYSNDQNLTLDGIRFPTIDGPGYFASAPTVFYIDNFAIESGSLLSVPNNIFGFDQPGNLYYNGEAIILENAPSGLQRIELYNIHGQLIHSTRVNDQVSQIHSVPFHSDDTLIIAILYDNLNRRYAKKIAILGK